MTSSKRRPKRQSNQDQDQDKKNPQLYGIMFNGKDLAIGGFFLGQEIVSLSVAVHGDNAGFTLNVQLEEVDPVTVLHRGEFTIIMEAPDAVIQADKEAKILKGLVQQAQAAQEDEPAESPDPADEPAA